MAPYRHPCSSTRFFGVRAGIYGTFAAEINIGRTRPCRCGLAPTAPEEAARAYDAAASRFGHGRDALNFPEIQSCMEAEFLVLPPLIKTACEQSRHESVQLRLSIAEADDRWMEE
jgi:hypothetical protein